MRGALPSVYKLHTPPKCLFTWGVPYSLPGLAPEEGSVLEPAGPVYIGSLQDSHGITDRCMSHRGWLENLSLQNIPQVAVLLRDLDLIVVYPDFEVKLRVVPCLGRPGSSSLGSSQAPLHMGCYCLIQSVIIPTLWKLGDSHMTGVHWWLVFRQFKQPV